MKEYESVISMVELRLDLLRPAERDPREIARWVHRLPATVPSILTIRRSSDLGRYEGDEAQRLILLEQILKELTAAAPSRWYVDIELDRAGDPQWDVLARFVRAEGGTVIRSHHVLRGSTPELSVLMARLAGEPREIPKLAVEVTSATAMARLVRSAREFHRRMPGRPAVWLGMGEYGMPTRAFPALLGSSWTYSTASGSEAVAPGQIPPEELQEIYRPDEVTAGAAVFGVLGSPVGHSRSPGLHNRWFQERDADAIYLPFRLDHFGEFPLLAETFDLRGVSVTVPHKEAALAFALQDGQGGATEEAVSVGAANTLVRDARGCWRAHNTDVKGFLAPLEGARVPSLAGRAVAVAGSGGAARAVVAALVGLGAEVHIFNRTRSRAVELARHFGIPAGRTGELVELERSERGRWAMVVQTTSVGMHPGTDPLGELQFAGGELVYDIIYTPRRTALLERAAQAGCLVINGSEMLLRQAELQRDLFFQTL